ncbi:wax ester/triacylglycerol synthase family O-acyltransferase [soil metagenome]
MERLSGLDATFLYVENPANHMHVAMTMVLDPSKMPEGYSFAAIKEFIRARIHLVPPFHRRLVQVPFRLHHPVWVDDPDFDLDYHVRRIGAPSPGGPKELAELAGQIASTPLDRSRPLWELWLIEGLEHDHVGAVTKVHHCAVDGTSGAELMVHLFDLEPVVGPPEKPTEIPAEHVPNDLELIGYAAASRLRRATTLLPLAGRTVATVAGLVQNRRDPDAQRGAIPLTAPRTPWNAAITPHRRTAFARVSLSDLKDVKNALDATVNDVVLAVCAGTLRRYLELKDALPDEPLVAVCPISVRTEDQGGSQGNRVSAMFTSLATDVDDPVERLRAIQKVTRGAKEEHNAVGATMLQNWAEFAAPTTFALASRLYTNLNLASSHRPIHNLIISNVPGPPVPLYYAGAQLVAAYPMGPLMEGAGLNVTVMSYRDSVDFGFMVCRELIPDVWDLADQVEPSFAELRKAAESTV